MTPAEKAGWKVGDRGVVRYFRNRTGKPFKEGSVVELHKDDGTSIAHFKLIDGPCLFSEGIACEELENVIRTPYEQEDPVNNPTHYTQGGVECIDAIRAALTEDEFRGYCKGAAMKYVWRERHKGGDESLRKARWYINELLGENER